MTPIAIGIDIGGTNTVFGLVDREGNCLEERRISTGEYVGVDAFLRHLFVELDLLIEAHPEYSLQGIGIGTPQSTNQAQQTDGAERHPHLHIHLC